MSSVKNRQGPPPPFDLSRIRPIEVVVEGSSREDFEYALRKFRSLFQRERIVGQLKEKMAYEKPSLKKRRKKREAVERRLQSEMRDKMIKNGEWDKRQRKNVSKKIQKDERNSKGLNND